MIVYDCWIFFGMSTLVGMWGFIMMYNISLLLKKKIEYTLTILNSSLFIISELTQ